MKLTDQSSYSSYYESWTVDPGLVMCGCASTKDAVDDNVQVYRPGALNNPSALANKRFGFRRFSSFVKKNRHMDDYDDDEDDEDEEDGTYYSNHRGYSARSIAPSRYGANSILTGARSVASSKIKSQEEVTVLSRSGLVSKLQTAYKAEPAPRKFQIPDSIQIELAGGGEAKATKQQGASTTATTTTTTTGEDDSQDYSTASKRDWDYVVTKLTRLRKASCMDELVKEARRGRPVLKPPSVQERTLPAVKMTERETPTKEEEEAQEPPQQADESPAPQVVESREQPETKEDQAVAEPELPEQDDEAEKPADEATEAQEKVDLPLQETEHLNESMPEDELEPTETPKELAPETTVALDDHVSEEATLEMREPESEVQVVKPTEKLEEVAPEVVSFDDPEQEDDHEIQEPEIDAKETPKDKPEDVSSSDDLVQGEEDEVVSYYERVIIFAAENDDDSSMEQEMVLDEPEEIEIEEEEEEEVLSEAEMILVRLTKLRKNTCLSELLKQRREYEIAQKHREEQQTLMTIELKKYVLAQLIDEHEEYERMLQARAERQTQLTITRKETCLAQLVRQHVERIARIEREIKLAVRCKEWMLDEFRRQIRQQKLDQEYAAMDHKDVLCAKLARLRHDSCMAEIPTRVLLNKKRKALVRKAKSAVLVKACQSALIMHTTRQSKAACIQELHEWSEIAIVDQDAWLQKQESKHEEDEDDVSDSEDSQSLLKVALGNQSAITALGNQTATTSLTTIFEVEEDDGILDPNQPEYTAPPPRPSSFLTYFFSF
uniref:Uncharacterized protein n=1 Tax=Entomoneis paludosa TaxID=265537 RepID=A0A7S3DLZ8_9STRA|mmetsp:Transcript_20240/g.42420  ORF Transcript_20240/g.42420 Transcript_20240/m.42420 type:complete len:779 (+) Transcript_20240:95-2431(+)